MYTYDNQIVHHNPCCNSFILQNNSLTTFLYVSTQCLSRELSFYYTFNKFASCYRSSCIRLFSQKQRKLKF